MCFLGYDKRKEKISSFLQQNGLENLEVCKQICLQHNVNVEEIVKEVQPIVFDDAVWAYVVGSALCLKNKVSDAQQCSLILGQALQAFTVRGSVAERRECGCGHGKLGAKLLSDDTKCFCFIAGHESFAAAEGAVALARQANKVRKNPLKVILVGLGKDAGYIIARMKGFTYVETKFDYEKNQVETTKEISFSSDERKDVLVFGCDSVMEGVEILKQQNVDISITGNSTNPTRFQHPVAGIYKKWCVDNGREFFSIASGGGTGRTLHPDNLNAGPASYGLTDTMGKMHADVQFAGSSSVPAHVDMMGFVGMGNNPMVGATVTLSVLLSIKNSN